MLKPNYKNFLSTMVKLLKEKKEIPVVTDQVSCPTSTSTLALMCWEIIRKQEVIFDCNKNPLPKFHCSDKGGASWYDVPKLISRFGLEIGIFDRPSNICPIIPMTTKEFNSIAKRPLFSLLNCESSFKKINFSSNNWEDELYKNMKKIVL